jgi:integrin beta 3
MPSFDWKKFADDVVSIIKQRIAASVDPIVARLKVLEERAQIKGDKGDKGDAGEKGIPGRDGIDGKDGKDGKNADHESVKQFIAEEVARQIAKIPQPKDGKDGQPGRDGLPGRDGMPGKDGKDGSRGLDGKDGRDGIDGLGFDDIVVEFDGERDHKLVFVQGERRKEFGYFSVPYVIDRGVWKEGQFKRGDGVSWGGSFFIAQRDTDKKPETIDSGWRLAVKRGRDGKDGKNGSPGPKGDKGDRGDVGPRGFNQ